MRLINADALKTKVKAMVTHKVNESDYEFGGNQALDYVADILIEDAPTIDAVEVVNRPICHELFTDGRQGVTIWLKNGDIIEYYPNKESEVEE